MNKATLLHGALCTRVYKECLGRVYTFDDQALGSGHNFNHGLSQHSLFL